jgi:hypothetical protein
MLQIGVTNADIVENGDASIFPASPRDHIAAVRTISTNESPVSPQATQARIGGFHLVLLRHVGDKDQGCEDTAFDSTDLCQVRVDLSERGLGLLVERRTLLRRNCEHRNYAVVHNPATAGRVSAG